MMGTFSMTQEEKAELQRAGSTTPVPIAGANGQNKGIYHNPVTGKEIESLADSYHMVLRLRQGWHFGPASPELREKWKVREAELLEEDDRMVEEHVASAEHQESERARFNDAVADAVTQVLERLGKTGVEVEAASPAATPVSDPNQSDFFSSVDSPPESETKHEVSQESRPALHLVE